MAKKSVANSVGVVGENSQMIKAEAAVEGELMRDKIYMIRGRQVMLDFDLAEIYGYETKAFNQQVLRNKERFAGEDFMFRLTREEVENLSRSHFVTSMDGVMEAEIALRSQNVTLKNGIIGVANSVRSQFVTSRGQGELFKGQGGGSRYLPYAFTEQGVYMLASVLKGEVAVQQSRALIMLFKAMKDYLIENRGLLAERDQLQVMLKVTEHTESIAKIERRLDTIDDEMMEMTDKMSDAVMKSEISPVLLNPGDWMEGREYIFMNGEPMKAKEAYVDIYKRAKKSIQVIDDYVDIRTLRILMEAKPGVKIIIYGDNVGKHLHLADYEDFRQESGGREINFYRTKEMVHDRFIIIDHGTKDEIIYHCGASSKDAGRKITAVGELSDELIRNAMGVVLERLERNGELELR